MAIIESNGQNARIEGNQFINISETKQVISYFSIVDKIKKEHPFWFWLGVVGTIVSIISGVYTVISPSGNKVINNFNATNSIQTVGQSGGTNIINISSDNDVNLSSEIDKLNIQTPTGYSSSFFLIYYSKVAITNQNLPLRINKMLKCETPIFYRTNDYSGGRYDGMKAKEFIIHCSSLNKIDPNITLFKI